MDVGELVAMLMSKGVDYVVTALPELIVKRQISREDASLVLQLALLMETRNLRNEFNEQFKLLSGKIDNLSSKIDEMRKETNSRFDEIKELLKALLDRVDVLNNQMRVLNANIASTYELTSKIMAKLMELSPALQGVKSQ